MDLSIYEIIKGPWVTTKAYRLNQDKKLVLEVHVQANKSMIAEALKKIFNADVEDVHTIVVKGKMKKTRKNVFQGKKRKKAIVTLKPGQDLNLSGLSVPIYDSAQKSTENIKAA